MGAAENISDLRTLLSIVAEETGALKMSDADEDSVGWTTEGQLPMTFGHVRRAHSALAALEAALSAATPVAARHGFDGHGFQYIDNGSGSDWKTRKPDAEMLYAAPTAPSVAVKALEWRTFCSRSGNCAAQSPLGEYVIQNEDDLWMVYLPYQDKRWGKGHDTLDGARAAAQADYEARIRSALSAQAQDTRSDDDEEIYEIGVREGYERAVQEIDMKTGGDGEYRYCTDHDPERHTPGPAEMIQRIVDRFETLNLIDDAEKRGDFWDAPGSAQVQDVAPTLKIGIYGKAYDRPDERRAYTYDHQPHNVEAHKLGRACSEIHSGGDWIDRGLNLLNSLQREGFGVFELPAAPAKQEG